MRLLVFTWSSAECLEVHELKWEVRVGRVVPLNSTGPVFGPCLIPHRSRADRFHSSLCVNFHILSTLSIFPDLSTNHRRASICCSQELVFFFIISGWQEYFSYLYFLIPEVKKVLSELSSRRSAAPGQSRIWCDSECLFLQQVRFCTDSLLQSRPVLSSWAS